MTRTITAGPASRVALLVCVTAAALGLAAAPALAATGSISGTVTSAATHEPLAGIEVCAITTAIFTPELEKELEEGLELGSEQLGCTTTEAAGGYTISGLGAGSFLVAFSNPFLGALNYVTQTYDGKESLEEGTEVTVTSGSTTGSVNAELHEGAEVSGTITNVATGAPLEGAFVCAAPVPISSTREGGCARATAGGAYMVVGLEAGAYNVFAFLPGFSTAFYGGVGPITEAASVTLALKEDHSGVNISLAPLSGTAGEGGSAQASPGAGAPPLGSSPGRNTAPVKGVELANAMIEEHNHRSVVVRLTCHSAKRCQGEISLTATRRIRRARRRLAQTVAIGSARFSARSGQTFAVRVRLSALGGSLLKRAHGHLAADLRIMQKAPRPKQTTVKRVLLVGRRAATKSAG